MKQYNTMFTKDYVPDWTVDNGVREFIANALDSDYPMEYCIGKDYIDITSVGVTLGPEVLTLGTSGNRNKKSAVGTHGEGILVGLIPILRSGAEVVFYNGAVTWTPKFIYDSNFNKEILVIEEQDVYNSTDNFSVFISGLSDECLEQVVDSCLYLQDNLGEVLEGTTGRVLVDRPNKLYVGGLFVCNINSKYSYDFKPEYLPLNRDRKSVDTWDLTRNTTRLLEEVMRPKDLAVLAKEHTLDSGGWYTRFKSDDVAEEFYQLAKKEYGNTFVAASTYHEAGELLQRGFKNVKVISNSNDLALIQQAPSYQEFLEELENVVAPEDSKTPLEMLWEWYDETELVDGIESLHKLLDIFEKRGVSFDS